MKKTRNRSLAGPPHLAKDVILSARIPQVQVKRTPKNEVPAAIETAKADIYQEGKELPLHIEVLPLSERPMIWNDIPEFASRHNRTIADIVYDLALLTSHAYAQKTKKRSIVPMDLELLINLYDLYPSSCSWKRPDIRETFDFLYGEKLAQFDAQYESAAQLAIGRRFARMLGRVGTAPYRWLSEEGKTTRRLENIVAKIHGIADAGQDPLTVFEAVSCKCWALRGIDIDSVFPMPTLRSVIRPAGTRGRRMTEAKKVRLPAVETYDGGAFSV